VILPAHRRMYLVAFLLDFSVAIGLTAMPFVVFQRLQGGPGMSGALGATQMALYAVGCLASARFITQGSNSLRHTLAGLALFALPFALVPFITDPLLCGLVASVPFIGLALTWPALQAWLGTEPDLKKRARMLTGFNAATAFGFTLSPLLAGPMFDLDYRLPFLLLLLVCLVVAALIKSLPPECGKAQADASGGGAPDAEPALATTPGLLYASWGATFTASGLFACVRSVYPSRVDSLVGEGALSAVGAWQPAWLGAMGPATVFSWLAFILSLTTVACYAILGGRNDWQGRFHFIVAGQVIAAAAFVVLGATGSLAGMLGCFVLVGANFGLCFFASMFYSLAEPREKHRRAAINEGVLGAGGFVGGIGAGYAAERIGLTETLFWIPVFVLLGIVVQLWLIRAFRTVVTEDAVGR
jgi:MFS family permease